MEPNGISVAQSVDAPGPSKKKFGRAAPNSPLMVIAGIVIAAVSICAIVAIALIPVYLSGESSSSSSSTNSTINNSTTTTITNNSTTTTTAATTTRASATVAGSTSLSLSSGTSSVATLGNRAGARRLAASNDRIRVAGRAAQLPEQAACQAVVSTMKQVTETTKTTFERMTDMSQEFIKSVQYEKVTIEEFSLETECNERDGKVGMKPKYKVDSKDFWLDDDEIVEDFFSLQTTIVSEFSTTFTQFQVEDNLDATCFVTGDAFDATRNIIQTFTNCGYKWDRNAKKPLIQDSSCIKERSGVETTTSAAQSTAASESTDLPTGPAAPTSVGSSDGVQTTQQSETTSIEQQSSEEPSSQDASSIEPTEENENSTTTQQPTTTPVSHSMNDAIIVQRFSIERLLALELCLESERDRAPCSFDDVSTMSVERPVFQFLKAYGAQDIRITWRRVMQGEGKYLELVARAEFKRSGLQNANNETRIEEANESVLAHDFESEQNLILKSLPSCVARIIVNLRAIDFQSQRYIRGEQSDGKTRVFYEECHKFEDIGEDECVVIKDDVLTDMEDFDMPDFVEEYHDFIYEDDTEYTSIEDESNNIHVETEETETVETEESTDEDTTEDPITDDDEPTDDNEYPTDDNDEPTDDNEYPTDDNEYPDEPITDDNEWSDIIDDNDGFDEMINTDFLNSLPTDIDGLSTLLPTDDGFISEGFFFTPSEETPPQNTTDAPTL